MTPKTDSVAVLREIEREMRELAASIARAGINGFGNHVSMLADRLATLHPAPPVADAVTEALRSLRFGQATIVGKDDYTAKVWGWFIGPFMVWEVHPSNFNLTHVASGYAVQKSIPEQAKAIVLAARLAGMADWSFTDAAAVKDWPPELVAQITTLRAWARNEGVDDPLGFVEVPRDAAALAARTGKGEANGR